MLAKQELAGRDAYNFLEEAGEVMWKLKTQHAGCLADITSLHQQALADIDDIGVNVVDGSGACGLTEQVAKIVG